MPKISEFNLIKCPEFIEKATSPAIEEIGQTLGNIFYLIFSPFNFAIEKLKIKQAENLKKYETDIKNQLSKIPQEKLIEPQLNIVGPALDASKFYIEKDEFRKMFAKLIASSMNIDNRDFSHSSFIEIIKQLSPFDALVLKDLSVKSSHPVITYRLIEKNCFPAVGFDALKNLIKLDCINENTLDFLNLSLDNLSRLNLISITYENQLDDFSEYDSTLKFFEDVIKPKAEAFYLIQEQFKNRKFEPVFGILDLTSYGKTFISICVD